MNNDTNKAARVAAAEIFQQIGETNNRARIVQLVGGISLLQIDCTTKIENPKRQSLFVNMALDAIVATENAVSEMTYQEVERLSKEIDDRNSTI